MFTQGGHAAVSAASVAGSAQIAPESSQFIRGRATAMGC